MHLEACGLACFSEPVAHLLVLRAERQPPHPAFRRRAELRGFVNGLPEPGGIGFQCRAWGGTSTNAVDCAILPARSATSSTATVSGDASQLAENVSGEILRSVESSCNRPSASSFSTIAVGITAMPGPSIAIWMTVASEALACRRIGGRPGRLNSERTIS